MATPTLSDAKASVNEWPRCSLCGEPHDEIFNYLFENEYRRIPDGDLAAELAYVQREIVEATPERSGPLTHRRAVLEGEAQRRRRIAAKGGPLYRGRGSISQATIDAAKRVDIADLISRDLDIAWMRRERTYFHCPAHGSGRDSNPSLVAYEDQGSWWCFGCNSGGDAIDWLISRHGLSFRQAVERLAAA